MSKRMHMWWLQVMWKQSPQHWAFACCDDTSILTWASSHTPVYKLRNECCVMVRSTVLRSILDAPKCCTYIPNATEHPTQHIWSTPSYRVVTSCNEYSWRHFDHRTLSLEALLLRGGNPDVGLGWRDCGRLTVCTELSCTEVGFTIALLDSTRFLTVQMVFLVNTMNQDNKKEYTSANPIRAKPAYEVEK